IKIHRFAIIRVIRGYNSLSFLSSKSVGIASSSFFDENEFFIDQSRCIGCQACVQACAECDTHRGHSMIHLEYIDRPTGVQTAPVVCMHCEDPTCARVCPADAIKQDDNGIV